MHEECREKQNVNDWSKDDLPCGKITPLFTTCSRWPIINIIIYHMDECEITSVNPLSKVTYISRFFRVLSLNAHLCFSRTISMSHHTKVLRGMMCSMCMEFRWKFLQSWQAHRKAWRRTSFMDESKICFEYKQQAQQNYTLSDAHVTVNHTFQRRTSEPSLPTYGNQGIVSLTHTQLWILQLLTYMI